MVHTDRRDPPMAVPQAVPGSAADASSHLGTRPSARRGQRWLASPVPTDALATDRPRRGHPRTTEAGVLEIRRTLVLGRLSATYPAAAYAQVVPDRRRRTGGVSHAAEAPRSARRPGGVPPEKVEVYVREEASVGRSGTLDLAALRR